MGDYMKKVSVLAAVTAAFALTSSSALAEGMEKCRVVKDGKGLIKEHRGDCATSKYSCQGHNPAGDAEAWILVPKGDCEKINSADPKQLDEVDETILIKIDTETLLK